jgi:hypothetical protein
MCDDRVCLAVLHSVRFRSVGVEGAFGQSSCLLVGANCCFECSWLLDVCECRLRFGCDDCDNLLVSFMCRLLVLVLV